jgi:hypothetical protein
MVEYHLEPSAQGMSRIRPGQPDFPLTFIIVSNRSEVPSCLARFLSPLMPFLIDDGTAEYTVITPDHQGYFHGFLELARGRPLPITSASVGFYANLAVEMANDDIGKRIEAQITDAGADASAIEALLPLVATIDRSAIDPAPLPIPPESHVARRRLTAQVCRKPNCRETGSHRFAPIPGPGGTR